MTINKTLLFKIFLILITCSCTYAKTYSVNYPNRGRLNGDTLEIVESVKIEEDDINDIKVLMEVSKKLGNYTKVHLVKQFAAYKISAGLKKYLIPDFDSKNVAKLTSGKINVEEVQASYKVLKKYGELLKHSPIIKKRIYNNEISRTKN